MKPLALAGLIGLLLAGAAVSQPLSGKEARKMLFSQKGVEVTMRPDAGLSPALSNLLESVTLQVARDQGYYGAVAYSPDDGLQHAATVALARYHSVQAAANAALKVCNEARKGAAECRVAAEIRPAKWKERPLTLSRAATEGFEKTYRRAKAPKALAISPQTGAWAIAQGGDAKTDALAKCNKDAGTVSDCETVIFD